MELNCWRNIETRTIIMIGINLKENRVLRKNRTTKWIEVGCQKYWMILFLWQIKCNAVHGSEKHKNIGSWYISTDVWCEERKKITRCIIHWKKGRNIFQWFSIIKPLENNSSDRYIILPVTGSQRGVKSTVRCAVFSLQGNGNISIVQVSFITLLADEWIQRWVYKHQHTLKYKLQELFLWDQTRRQRSSWRSVLSYECLPN